MLGKVTGNQKNGFVEFKGIPFTQHAPVANYRFTQAILKSTPYPNNRYDATYYRDACIQTPFALATSFKASEDCLYLNIFTPNIDENGRVSDNLLPVMVWIHGGGFVIGTGADSDGISFMRKKNVIFVSINYRLGLLGFLSSESIYTETNGKTTGSMNGINDQIVALKWIQKYIADYGGDPDKVTIFGESAGGISVCYLSMIPLAAGLFDQAIIESAHCSSTLTDNLPTKQRGLSYSKNVLNTLNLTDNLEVLRAVKDVSIFSNVFSFPNLPAVDGYLLQQQTHTMLVNNDYTINVDKIIIGSNNMDTTISFPFSIFLGDIIINKTPLNDDEFDAYLNLYISNEQDIYSIKNIYYPLSDFPSFTYKFGEINQEFSSQEMRWAVINGDVCFKCSGVWYLEQLIKNENNCDIDLYLYNFIGPTPPNYATHAAELPFIFNDNSSASSAEFYGINYDESLANLMHDTWVNFGVYGKPNSTLTTEEWVSYNANRGAMVFGNDGINSNYNLMNFNSKGYRNGVCDFWTNHIGFDVMSLLCEQKYSLELQPNSTTTTYPTRRPGSATPRPTYPAPRPSYPTRNPIGRYPTRRPIGRNAKRRPIYPTRRPISYRADAGVSNLEPLSPEDGSEFIPLETSKWTINLSSPWIISIALVLSIILFANIVFMFYRNYYSKNLEEGIVFFDKRRRNKYCQVIVIDDSNSKDLNDLNDDSEANLIEAEVMDHQQE